MIHSIKPGVDLHGVRSEMAIAYTIACSIYQTHGYNCILTSVNDGLHSKGSKHYVGLAIDLRTNNVLAKDIPLITKELAASLGAQFDVLFEGDHFHIEFDPETPT